MMSAESINRIFFPALIAIREADPFVAMCSCGDIPITIATPFPSSRNAAPHGSGSYFLPKPESPMRNPPDESFHLQHLKPTPRRGDHCHEGLSGLLRIARVD